jgi:hypothetical protein
MRPSIVYCRQFQASRGLKDEVKKEDPVAPEVPESILEPPAMPKPETKRRGRKPGSKKVSTEPTFKIIQREIIMDFS